MAPPESSQDPQQTASSSSSSPSAATNQEAQSAYNDLRRLIPMLASELDQLRAALREHNLWLQRYGHSAASAPSNAAGVDASTTTGTTTPAPAAAAAAASDLPGYTNAPELPGYSASDVPPYTGGPNSVSLMASSASTSTREEVEHRRDELTNWLAEGEDTLREYSARFAQLGEQLGISPPEDVLGTWNEASPDNALPDYTQVETREELMVGGVGEVPPPYVRGMVMEKARR